MPKTRIQKSRTILWNKLNKLKKIYKMGNTSLILIPKSWIKEIGFDIANDFFLMSFEPSNETIILKKANKEEFEL